MVDAAVTRRTTGVRNWIAERGRIVGGLDCRQRRGYLFFRHATVLLHTAPKRQPKPASLVMTRTR